jgi:hypothetical protein
MSTHPQYLISYYYWNMFWCLKKKFTLLYYIQCVYTILYPVRVSWMKGMGLKWNVAKMMHNRLTLHSFISVFTYIWQYIRCQYSLSSDLHFYFSIHILVYLVIHKMLTFIVLRLALFSIYILNWQYNYIRYQHSLPSDLHFSVFIYIC